MTHHQTQIPLRWADMDAFGHLNNVAFFRLLKEARAQWITELGHALDGRGIGPVVLKAECLYLKAVVYPDQVVIDTCVSEMGRSSLTLSHTMTTLKQPQAHCAEGEIKLVWIDYQSGHSVPIPDELRELFTRYQT